MVCSYCALAQTSVLSPYFVTLRSVPSVILAISQRGYPPALTVVFGLNAASAVIARFWRRAYLRKSKSRKAQTLGALRQALNTFETPSRLSILSSSRVCHLS